MSILGITLHCSKEIPNFGGKSTVLLTRLTERATAKNIQKALVDSLANVGLELVDIRGITTDAASVMRKLGRNLKLTVAPRPFYHQLCLAHGIHLAVLDALNSTSSSRNNAAGIVAIEAESDEEEVELESESGM